MNQESARRRISFRHQPVPRGIGSSFSPSVAFALLLPPLRPPCFLSKSNLPSSGDWHPLATAFAGCDARQFRRACSIPINPRPCPRNSGNAAKIARASSASSTSRCSAPLMLCVVNCDENVRPAYRFVRDPVRRRARRIGVLSVARTLDADALPTLSGAAPEGTQRARTVLSVGKRPDGTTYDSRGPVSRDGCRSSNTEFTLAGR